MVRQSTSSGYFSSVNLVQIQVITGTAQVPSGTGLWFAVNPRHKIYWKLALSLKILERIVDKIIFTGPPQRYGTPPTFRCWIDHPMVGCYLFSKAATRLSSC